MKGKKTAICFLFALIFSELIGFRLWAQEEAGGERITGFYIVTVLVLSLVLSKILAPFILGMISRHKTERVPLQRKFTLRKSFVLLWILLFLCYVPCFLAFYPGLYNNDMVWQWAMYSMKSYNTHHPILHTYLTGSLFELGKRLFGSYDIGLAVNSIFQLLILSGSIAYALNYLIRIGVSKRFFQIACLFYAIYPYIPVMGVSTTKDTLFASLFTIVFVCLTEMLQTKTLYQGPKLLAFLLVFILSGMLRNNGSYSFVLTLFFLMVWVVILKIHHKDSDFQKKLILLIGSGVVITQLCLFILTGMFHAEKGKVNEMLSVPCQQMARAYLYNGSKMTAKEQQELFSYIPEENIENYKYYISDPVKNVLNTELFQEAPAEFVQLWLKIGKKCPREYMEAFLNNTFGVWYLTGDTGSNLPYEYNPFFDNVHTFTEASKLPALKRMYKWFHYKNYEKYLPLVSMIFYTPFFNWMVVLSFCVLVVRKQFHLLILPIFLFSYIFTILLGPCVPVRYLFNIILCAPFLFTLTMPASASARTV